MSLLHKYIDVMSVQAETPIPLNEPERLAALHSLRVLDTPPSEPFERIVRNMAEHYDVPICAVSLVDSDRQWFKAICGLDVQQTPRDISFCTHTILHDEKFVVLDAAQDPLFANNPLVTEAPHIRFYAGVPLLLDGTFPVGSLCLISDEPRSHAPDLGLLEVAAHEVTLLLRKHWLHVDSGEVSTGAKLVVGRSGGQITCAVSGNLHMSSAEGFFDRTMGMIDQQSVEKLSLCLAEVERMDSAGLGAVIKLYKNCRSSAIEFEILQPSPIVATLLDKTNLSKVLPIRA